MRQTPAAVLLVNDTPDEREMYAEYLRSRGYETLEAETVNDGWRMASELGPVLVVTDMVLRGGTGIDLLARLKTDTRTSGLPVIMLTGRIFELDRVEAARAGADLFLAKPCLPSQLADEIRTTIEKLGEARAAATDRPRRTAKARLDSAGLVGRPRSSSGGSSRKS
jgi:DNA-binding response OmpR family regulator